MLVATRRFGPLFTTQFLGAFNDNLFKNALAMLIAYRLGSGDAGSLITLAAGVFILPFFLLSATAGQFADSIDRAKIARIVKLAEIVLMTIAATGFYLASLPLLFAVLFGLGVHSAFFGPVKYALLPQHLPGRELLSGNAYVEAGTFLAILLGTLAGGLLVLRENGGLLISASALACAILGYVASRLIPPAPAPSPGIRPGWNLLRETWRVVGYARGERVIFRTILGISWFWLIGATFLSQFPNFARNVLHADETVVTLFLVLFSVGIGVGSFLCNLALKGKTTLQYAPVALLGIAVFTLDLAFVAMYYLPTAGPLADAARFLSTISGIRIALDLSLAAICGGIYAVPLYTFLQEKSETVHRARTIAANNIVNALFMVLAALAALALLALSFTIPQIFLLLGMANIGAAFFLWRVY